MARWSATLGGLTYLVWVGAIVAYSLAMWGSSTTNMEGSYVVGLGKATDSRSTNITLGYSGICFYSRSSDTSKSSSNPISKCTYIYNFPANDNKTNSGYDQGDGSAVLKHFLDELNLENETKIDKNTLTELLLVARVLKNKVFAGTWMIAALALLIVSGIIAIPPLFFYMEKRRTICMVLMAFTGLCMGFGLMTGCAAALTTRGALAVLDNEESLASTLGQDSWPVEFSDSDQLYWTTWAAIILNAIYVFFCTISSVVRNHRQRIKQRRQVNTIRPPVSQTGLSGKFPLPKMGKKGTRRTFPGIGRVPRK